MSNRKSPTKYNEEFNKTIVNFHQSGKSYEDIQKKYGVSSSALSNWVRKYSKVRVYDDTVLTAKQIKALQRRNAELEEENIILKKRLQYSRNTQTKIRSGSYSVRAAFNLYSLQGLECKNRSTYYKFLNRESSCLEHDNTQIKQKILEIYAKADKRIGFRKVKICLERDYCINISEGRVYRLMKEMNLPKMITVEPPKQKKHFENGVCKNVLAQNFKQSKPNMVWVCDFTYVRVSNSFYYVCVILNLYSIKVIAYRTSNKIDIILAIETLRDAVKMRKASSGVMFHSDRGAQFTSNDFRKEIDRLNMIQPFLKSVILTTTPLLSAFSST